MTDNNRRTSNVRKDIPKLDEFLDKRDYSGALTLVEFNASATNNNVETDMWIAYCNFHLGNYKKAVMIYNDVRKKEKISPNISTTLACCYFFLGMYHEAKDALNDAPESNLKNRLLLHLAHKIGDEEKLKIYHEKLNDIIEDQLCLASIHYLRAHYQEAIDIYKKILLENR